MITTFVKRLLAPILYGLALAGLLLLLFPTLRYGDTWQAEDAIGFANPVRRAAPAVVNIYSGQHCQDKTFEPQGLGSGVIMSTDGVLLTNSHVVEQAEEILVALQDSRIFRAELVGSDPLTDLAVLRITADNLPVIPLPAKHKVQVGDLALAIGNPYNLGLSITQGIISAKGRTGMSASGYQDFIQTDAVIHAGNSGGALINARGELIGINTAILAETQIQAQGIGFAIPLPLANRVMIDLLQYGRVIRGYLGVEAVTLSTQPAGITGGKGVMITGVTPGSPASEADLKQHDVLLSIDGTPLNHARQALDMIAETRPGTSLNLVIWREGEKLELTAGIREREQPQRRPLSKLITDCEPSPPRGEYPHPVR